MRKIENLALPGDPAYRAWPMTWDERATYYPKRTLPRALICDLDGTLTSCEWRRHYVDDPHHTDWASFNAGIPFDAIVPEVLARITLASWMGLRVLLTTGRKDSARHATMCWLEKYDVPYDSLFMRSSKDNRSDAIVKREIYLRDIKPRHYVVMVIDDRPSVCQMWLDQGLRLSQVIDPGIAPPIGLTSR